MTVKAYNIIRAVFGYLFLHVVAGHGAAASHILESAVDVSSTNEVAYASSHRLIFLCVASMSAQM